MYRRGTLIQVILLLSSFLFVNYGATISGVVKDSVSGDPLAGAIVRLRSGNTTLARDTTDEEGKFSFSNVEADTYALSITLTGYTQKSMNLVVEGDDISDLEILLVKPITTTVSGVVKDSVSGNTLSGAIVRLTRGTISLRDTTDSNGFFSFSNVEAGSYSIRITLEGYREKSVSLEVGSEPVTIEVGLTKPITTTVSGIVKDSIDGTPLKGAVVRIRRGNATLLRDTTSEDGKFSFTEVATDTYNIQVTLNKYTTKTIQVTVGSEPVSVEILMVKSPTTTISGVVKDSSSGTALAGAIVELRSGGGMGGGIGGIIDSVKTDNEGKFIFSEISTGSYTLRASISGYTAKSVSVRIDSIAPVDVDILLNKVVYGTIIGKVTSDSLNGTPIKEARVILARTGQGGMGGGIDTAYTDAEGKYSFENVECNVTYTLTVSKDGYSSRSTTLMNKKVGADTVNIYLTTLVTKTIKVIVKKASDSSVIVGANVAVRRSNSTTILAANTDATGKAVFENLLEGNYTISSAAEGFRAAALFFNVSANSSDSVVQYLVADSVTRKITGVVSDSLSNTPIEGAIVYITVRPEGAASSIITLASITDNSGTYTIVGIPKGINSVTVSAVKSSYITTSKNLFIDTFTVSTLNLKMLPINSKVENKKIYLQQSHPYISNLSSGDIIIHNLRGKGRVQIIDLKGKEVYNKEYVSNGSLTLSLNNKIISPQFYIIKILEQEKTKTFTNLKLFIKR